MQNRFVELIREERRRGKTILMSSHMFEEVERTCDRVGIIRQGRLVAVDEVEALKKAKRRRYTVTLADEAEAAAFAAEGLRVAGREGCRVTVEVQTDLQAFIGRHGAGTGGRTGRGHPVAGGRVPSVLRRGGGDACLTARYTGRGCGPLGSR